MDRADLVPLFANSQRSRWFNALYDNNTDMVIDLIRDGVQLNWQDRSGNTALHIAAKSSNTLLLHALLDAGADPHIKNTEDFTPAQCALVYGSTLATLNLLFNFIDNKKRRGSIPGR